MLINKIIYQSVATRPGRINYVTYYLYIKLSVLSYNFLGKVIHGCNCLEVWLHLIVCNGSNYTHLYLYILYSWPPSSRLNAIFGWDIYKWIQ